MKRRNFLTAGLFAAAAPLTLGCGRAIGQPAQCVLTGADIEGPFFRPGAPRRSAMVAGRAESIRLHGVVMDRRCAPVAGARIELWQADADGRYDLDGFAFRAHLITDRSGRWEIETIVPGRYLNGTRYRPAHVHAKVATPARSLTTQLYFPDDPFNVDDPWFDPSRLVRLDEHQARFDFVV